jgi:hypothetical protein
MASNPESTSKSSRRVRFSETAEVLAPPEAKRRRFDPMEALEGKLVCLLGLCTHNSTILAVPVYALVGHRL